MRLEARTIEGKSIRYLVQDYSTDASGADQLKAIMVRKRPISAVGLELFY